MEKSIYDYCDMVIGGKVGVGKTEALLHIAMQKKGKIGIYCLDEDVVDVGMRLDEMIDNSYEDSLSLKEEDFKFMMYGDFHSPSEIGSLILEDKLDYFCIDHINNLTKNELLEICKVCEKHSVKLIITSQLPLRHKEEI